MKTILYNILLFLILDVAIGVGYDAYKTSENNEKKYRIKSPVYHHGIRPNYSGITYWEAGRPYRVDSDNLGLKSREGKHTRLEKNGERTVWIGDSFTEGVGYEYDSTFVGLFDAKYPRHEMLNMGVVSYSPVLYKSKLRYFLDEGLEFDNLVVCIDISDIQDEVIYRREGFGVDDPKPFSLRGFILGNIRYSITLRMVALVCYRNEDAKTEEVKIDMDDRAAWATDRRVFDAWGREGLIMAASNMDEIFRWNSKAGRKTVIVIYPWPYQIINRSYVNIHTVFWKDFCAQRGIPLVDLFPDFEEACRTMGEQKVLDSFFVKGDVHWNQKGHDFIYRSIDKRLREHQLF